MEYFFDENESTKSMLMDLNIKSDKCSFIKIENPSIEDFQRLSRKWDKFKNFRSTEINLLIIAWTIFILTLIYLLIVIAVKKQNEKNVEIYIIAYSTVLSCTIFISAAILYGHSRRRSSLLVIEQNFFDQFLLKKKRK
jgi:hypothetical protein